MTSKRVGSRKVYLVCTPPFLSARGIELPPKLSKKRGLDRTSIFRDRLLGKRGVTFFRGREFLHKK